jgi:integrase
LVRKRGHKPLCKTFARKALAEKWAREQEVELEQRALDGQHHDIGALTLRYIKEIGAIKKWERTHASNLRRFALDVEGITLADMTAEWMVAYGRKRKVSPATVSLELYYLSSVLHTAESLWRMSVPWSEFRRGRKLLQQLGLAGKSQERTRRPQGDEIARIKAKLQTTLPMADIIDFAAITGMRVAEITRIQWADVDEVTRCVLVRDRKHPTKKKGNHQSVPLLGEAWGILKRQPVGDGAVFPYRPESVATAFQRARKRAGVVGLRFHDLRHHGISRMFEQGYAIPEVAMVSGHQDWKQLRRYTNLKPESLHDGPASRRTK